MRYANFEAEQIRAYTDFDINCITVLLSLITIITTWERISAGL